MRTKQSGTKRWNIRHGHGSRRCNAVEKAIETAARRESKRRIQEELESCEETNAPEVAHGSGQETLR